MRTAEECRHLARQYQDQTNKAGTSPRMATVLKNMSKSFSGLANQYDVLFAIAAEERKQR